MSERMIMEFKVLLKPGTADGEIKQPLVPPEAFSVLFASPTRELLLRSVKRIVDRGEKPMMQIQLCYMYGGLTVIESPMVPICFTETPGVYPLRSE